MTYNFDWVDGFEHQTLSSASFGPGTTIWEVTADDANITFPAGRTGVCLHIDGSSPTVATYAAPVMATTQTRVFSGYFRVPSAPSVLSQVFALNDVGGAQIGRFRIATDGTWELGCWSGSAETAGQVADNAWHRLDVLFDTSTSGTWTGQWYLDGIAQTDFESGTGKIPTDAENFNLGSSTAAHTVIVDWDDCCASTDPAMFPVGSHHVAPYSPTDDGTHVPGTNVIERESDGADLNGTTVEAWPLLDELPMTTTNSVEQVSGGSGNYAEVTFANDAAGAGEVIGGVSTIVGLTASSGGAQTGNPTTRFVAGAHPVFDLFSGDQSTTTLTYVMGMIPGSGTWDNTLWNVLVCRVGFRTDAVGGDPRWNGVLVQALIIEAETVTLSQTATAIITTRSLKTYSSTAIIVSPITSRTHTSTAIVRKTLTRVHNSDAQITQGPARRTNTFEGGANGTTITTGNSGGASGDAFQNILISTGATLTYDSTQAIHGLVSARMDPAPNTQVYVAYLDSVGTQTTIFGRAYMRLTAIPTQNSFFPVRVLDDASPSQTCAALNIRNDARVHLVDANLTLQGATPNDATGQVVANSWFRLEWQFVGDAVSGSITVRLYLDPASLTPSSTATATNINTRSAFGKYRIGQTSSAAEDLAVFNVDAIGWDTATWLGLAPIVGTRSYTSSAHIKGTLTRLHTSSAVLRTTNTRTQTADAIILLRPVKTHTSDAIVLKTLTVVHTSDAFVAKAGILPHSSDAYIAAGFTPEPNSWVVVDVVASNSPSVPSPSVTDTAGSIFVREAESTLDGSTRLSRFYAPTGPNPVPRSIVVNFGTDPQDQVLVEVYQILGVDLEDPFVRTQSFSDPSSVSSISIDLPTFSNTSNRGLIAATHGTDEDSDPEVDWNEVEDLSEGGMGLAVAWSDDDDNTGTYSWATASTDAISIFSEIQVLRSGFLPQTADAIIRRSATRTQSATAIVSKALTRTHTTTAIVGTLATVVQHDSDAFLQNIPLVFHTTTAAIFGQPTRTHRSDAYLTDLEPPPPVELFTTYRLALANRSQTGLGSEIIPDVVASIGLLEGAVVTWTEELNEAGRLEFALPIDHPSVTRATFAPGQREIHLYRGDAEELVWGGDLMVAETRGWEVRFVAFGWYDKLARRTVKQDYTSRAQFNPQTGWTYIDQAKIVRELLAIVEAESPLGIENYDTADTGVTRKLTLCAEERRLVSDVIEDFASASNGFDFAVLPDKRFRIWSPRRESTSPVMSLDGTVFAPDLVYTIDTAELVTQVTGLGPDEDCARPDTVMQSDPTAVANYGILDGTVDLQKHEDPDLRAAIVSEALGQGSSPRFQTTITLPSVLDAVPDLGDYGIGDSILITADRGASGGFGDFTIQARILKRQVTVSTPGYEDVKLTIDVESIT